MIDPFAMMKVKRNTEMDEREKGVYVGERNFEREKEKEREGHIPREGVIIECPLNGLFPDRLDVI